MQKILVVEDDLSIQEVITEFLSDAGYLVDATDNGQKAYELFKENNYDLIITDVMMDIMDGYDLVKLIRKHDNEVKIIMLTALQEEYNEVKGFDLGVNDYISKPFPFKVLLKRVEAQLKQEKPNIIQVDNIVLNDKAHTVEVAGETVEMTLKEFEILKLLMLNLNTVVSREQLLNDIWGYDYFGDSRVIDSHIKNIRKKTNTSLIKTVSGVGYKMEQA